MMAKRAVDARLRAVDAAATPCLGYMAVVLSRNLVDAV